MGLELFPSAPKPPMGFRPTHGGMAATSPTVSELVAHVVRSDAWSRCVTIAGAHPSALIQLLSSISSIHVTCTLIMFTDSSDLSFLVVLIVV